MLVITGIYFLRIFVIKYYVWAKNWTNKYPPKTSPPKKPPKTPPQPPTPQKKPTKKTSPKNKTKPQTIRFFLKFRYNLLILLCKSIQQRCNVERITHKPETLYLSWWKLIFDLRPSSMTNTHFSFLIVKYLSSLV